MTGISSKTARRLAIAALLCAAIAAAAPAPAAQARGANGTIANAAGTPGTPGFAGDGGPADQALLHTPQDVAFLASGGFAIADFQNNRVRHVRPDGRIETAAGTGDRDLAGDGGPATGADLNRPRGVTALPGGGYLIADTFNHRVRRVAPDGTISTLAGSGPGYGGDGGPATAARLNFPSETAVLGDGSVLIADTGNHRVRRVAPDGRISTVAGTGIAGLGGDGGPASVAQLSSPQDVTPDTRGGFLIADTGNHRIRRVAPDGTISTAAGTFPGLSGDGDPARVAQTTQPASVAPLPNGGFLFTDTGNGRVRRVTPLGAIFTVAGTTPGRAGDGGPANQARLLAPAGVTLAPGGGFLVADTGNAIVRRVTDIGAIPPAALGRSVNVDPVSGNVVVRPAGAGDYLPLRELDLVPNGSAVDATRGRLRLAVSRDAGGALAAADVYSGPFRVRQLRGPRPATDFALPAPPGCAPTPPTARTASARPLARTSGRRRKRRRARRLWVSDRGGRWRTSTGSVTAAALGTRWLTTRRCDATLVTVRQGRVRVRDRVARRTVTLRRNQTYLARNRRR